MELRRIREGTTELCVPAVDHTASFPPSTVPVFYNPAMELNRDATILLLAILCPDHYLDAMGATGIRGFRAAHECGIPVTINDHNPRALELIRSNAARLNLPCECTGMDVNVLCSSRRFDAVDLDPFGTPAPFIDSLIRSARRYLFVSATDTAPLCGAHRKAGMRRYGARPRNTDYHAEVALRILLGFVCRETIKYDRGIEPLFCFARSHYVRLHCTVTYGTRAADRALDRMGYVHHCPRCSTRKEQKGLIAETSCCPSCRQEMEAIGPLWMGKIADPSILQGMQAELPQRVLNTARDLAPLIATCREELPLSYHYDYHKIAQQAGCSPPPVQTVLEELRARGYAATRAHYSGTALKTDAPLDVLSSVIQRVSSSR
jgi:tRNA (guanine26-N2/guanine27-N2)-dimethyltransferase